MLEQALTYEVVHSQRRTTDIVIDRDGSLLVRAPEGTYPEKIENIVRSKRLWIYKNLAN